MKFKKLATLGLAILTTLSLAACSDSDSGQKATNDQKPKVTQTSKQSSKKQSTTVAHHKQAVKQTTKAALQQHSAILHKLVYYTNHESAGPTGNYYYVNGKAKLSGFGSLKAGNYHFASDSQGRSATARAVLTYSEYRSSRGSRQGDPLAPPAWPDNNPRVAINYGLTGRTYHGYLYNRSHSIGDSLLGTKSYTSQYNFTTGTRPQNVGADQDGGMRHAEETVENYWESHPGTKHTVDYETTPLYDGDETIPRGSIVAIKSSDGVVNTEIVVINSVEGIRINYNDGSSNAKPIAAHHAATHHRQSTASRSQGGRATQAARSTTKQGKWTVAASGMVFVSGSNKFYTEVTTPGNYQYMSRSQAAASGATQAARGNQYARP